MIYLCAAGAHGPAHLDARIDAFLQTFEDTLRRLSPDELEGHRGALIASKTLKDASLADEADRNWEQISGKRCALRRTGLGARSRPCKHFYP